jgi:hypothetical protein
LTDRELIRAIGEACFGPRWQTDLADALQVSSRTVRRWASGADCPREGVWKDLAELARERRIKLDLIIARLSGATAGDEP